jgi:hypothetical protein
MVVEIKAGIKTTEFWVSLLAIVIVGGAAALKLDLDVATVTGVVTSAVAYIASRVAAKRATTETKPE